VAVQSENLTDIEAPEWDKVREMLAGLSRSRAEQGFTPSETATFVLSFKQPLFTRLGREVKDAEMLADDMWATTVILDKLGLYTTEVYQKSREDVVARQQAELMELSTPVVKLWEGVLAVPLIGILDSARTQTVMETLLQEILETGSAIAIIDITGVPIVDTLVAQHLLKTVSAARLMGADCSRSSTSLIKSGRRLMAANCSFVQSGSNSASYLVRISAILWLLFLLMSSSPFAVIT